jgi:RNA polymerase sigma factor (sigma-70 family)
MTIAEFLLRYELEGTRCMKDAYTDCRKICVGTLMKSGASEEQAIDIYQDAMIVLLDNAEKGKIRSGSAKLSTYIVQICLNKFRGEIPERGGDIIKSVDELPDVPEEKPDDMEEKLVQLEKCIERLSNKSKQLVNLWMEDFSHRSIAEKLGYANEHVSKSLFNEIKNTLRKCLGIGPKS